MVVTETVWPRKEKECVNPWPRETRKALMIDLYVESNSEK